MLEYNADIPSLLCKIDDEFIREKNSSLFPYLQESAD
jgi:hypothetical protein